MLERAARKLRLDQLVIQQGRQQLSEGATACAGLDISLICFSLAANKEELMEMITARAEKIINTNEECVPPLRCIYLFLILGDRSLMINDDIDAIIQRGEERMVELNSKYEGLYLDRLNNFKSDATVQQWKGEDFRSGVSLFTYCYLKARTLNCNLCSVDEESFKLQFALAVEA